MRVTSVTSQDLPTLATLEHAVFGETAYPAFFLRQAQELWPQWLLVAREESGALAGYALAAPTLTAGEAWVLSLATAPERRGCGHGGALFAALLQQLRRDGVRIVWLTVSPTNPAQRLYLRAGFTVVEELADYFGPGEARLKMRLELHPPAS